MSATGGHLESHTSPLCLVALAVVTAATDSAETLESIDLVVPADVDQLNAFYDSASEDENEDKDEDAVRRSLSKATAPAEQRRLSDESAADQQSSSHPLAGAVELEEAKEEEEETKAGDRDVPGSE